MEQNRELVDHLERVTGLERPVLLKVIEEVRAWYGQDLQAWIHDRHQELQRQGWRNREIYPRLQREIGQIRVCPPALTQRQIRRLIYG